MCLVCVLLVMSRCSSSCDLDLLLPVALTCYFRMVLLEDASYDLVELASGSLHVLLLAEPDAYIALAKQLVQQVRIV